MSVLAGTPYGDVPGFVREHAPEGLLLHVEAAQDAVRSALRGLDVPVVLDVDCGHVPPHLSLVGGALAELRVGPDGARLVQHLVP